ncbi:MotA/TolQ/ExbB proton channel family protein [Thermostilla marina]
MANLHRKWKAILYPFFWAAIGFASFAAVVSLPIPGMGIVRRYTTGHPVEYIETALFFLGAAVLVLKLLRTAGEYRLLQQLEGRLDSELGDLKASSIHETAFGKLLGAFDRIVDRLRQLSPSKRDTYPVRRIESLLEHLIHRQSPEGIDDRVVLLADQDREEQDRSFGFVRLIVWAIPILGFLGTVIGIALALGNLSPKALEETLPVVMAGLTVAFDTTALALALSIILMFLQFVADRYESGMLSQLDRLVDEQITARLPAVDPAANGELAPVRSLLETMISAQAESLRRQEERWNTLLDRLGATLAAAITESSEAVAASLGNRLADATDRHLTRLAEVESESRNRTESRWSALIEEAAAATAQLRSLQSTMERHVQTVGRAVQATDEIAKLESALNRNLETLAETGRFEEVVASLAAAVNLLSTQLDRRAHSAAGRVRLDSDSASEAA